MPSSLLDILRAQSSQQPQSLAPLPTGNVGAGSQPLALGQLVAQNTQINPSLAAALRGAFNGGNSQPPPQQVNQQASPPQVDPFANFANKATGKNYK